MNPTHIEPKYEFIFSFTINIIERYGRNQGVFQKEREREREVDFGELFFHYQNFFSCILWVFVGTSHLVQADASV